MKRIAFTALSVLIVLAFLSGTVTVYSYADASGSGWKLEGGVLTVNSSSVMGNASSAAEDYPWHAYRSEITAVVVGSGVKTVGRYAFDSCKNLKSVTFGENTDTFYNDCIARNSALKTVTFLCPAVYIGQGIVYLSGNIEKVTLTGQTKEEFKALATKCAYNFESYGGIRTGFDTAQFVVVIPYTYTIIDGVLRISGDGVDVGDGSSTADGYKWAGKTSGVTKVVIEEGVRSIGAHAFDGMPALAEIRVAASVTAIGDYAFANAPALERIWFAGTVSSYGEGVALGSTALKSVVLNEQRYAEFREKLLEKPYNLRQNGGRVSGFDLTGVLTVYTEGVWGRYGDLSAFGEDCKLYDVNKDGACNIQDVSVLLDYLGSDGKWVESFYNINKKGSTTINDVTALLDRLASGCAHTFAYTEAKAATCTEDGKNASYECTKCGGVLNSAAVIKAPGHTVVIQNAVAATCGTDGLTEGRFCSVCGEVFARQTVIPATGAHKYEDVAERQPTCGKDGVTAGRACAVCGKTESGCEVLPATGLHTAVTDPAVTSYCMRSGLTEGSHCAVCGQVLTAQETVPAKGHSYLDGRCIRCGKADCALIGGKSALFAGDSLCAASTFDTEHRWWGWARRISETYGLSRFDKTGADGASVSDCRGSNTIINQINGKKNNSYDYVILEGSTNDGWDNAPVGSVTSGSAASAKPSDFDLTTFSGGLENLIYYARKYFPTATVGYIFTHKMNSNTGSLRNMSAYLAAAKKICQKWDVPMLNVDESPDFAVKYFAGISALVPDGIHPSSAGYELLYPAIARFMAEITLDGGYAVYTAEIETVKEGPAPYMPIPERDEDPQGWINWLQKDRGDTVTMFESGRPYGVKYNADGKSHLASPFEYWSGHFQFDYIFDAEEIDLRDGIGKASYPYVWEIWYKDADVEEDYRMIRTKPWSVYAPSCIYRIETYDEGMNDLHLDPGSNENKYDIVIVICDKSGDIVGWRADTISFTDSTVLFIEQAKNDGAIG